MAYHTYLVNRSAAYIRGILVVAINDKSLRLPPATLSKVAALTLTTSDILGICRAPTVFHDAWSGILSIGIGAYVLQTYTGVAASVVAIPAVGEFSCQSIKRFGLRTNTNNETKL